MLHDRGLLCMFQTSICGDVAETVARLSVFQHATAFSGRLAVVDLSPLLAYIPLDVQF